MVKKILLSLCMVMCGAQVSAGPIEQDPGADAAGGAQSGPPRGRQLLPPLTAHVAPLTPVDENPLSGAPGTGDSLVQGTPRADGGAGVRGTPPAPEAAQWGMRRPADLAVLRQAPAAAAAAAPASAASGSVSEAAQEAGPATPIASPAVVAAASAALPAPASAASEASSTHSSEHRHRAPLQRGRGSRNVLPHSPPQGLLRDASETVFIAPHAMLFVPAGTTAQAIGSAQAADARRSGHRPIVPIPRLTAVMQATDIIAAQRRGVMPLFSREQLERARRQAGREESALHAPRARALRVRTPLSQAMARGRARAHSGAGDAASHITSASQTAHGLSQVVGAASAAFPEGHVAETPARRRAVSTHRSGFIGRLGQRVRSMFRRITHRSTSSTTTDVRPFASPPREVVQVGGEADSVARSMVVHDASTSTPRTDGDAGSPHLSAAEMPGAVPEMPRQPAFIHGAGVRASLQRRSSMVSGVAGPEAGDAGQDAAPADAEAAPRRVHSLIPRPPEEAPSAAEVPPRHGVTDRFSLITGGAGTFSVGVGSVGQHSPIRAGSMRQPAGGFFPRGMAHQPGHDAENEDDRRLRQQLLLTQDEFYAMTDAQRQTLAQRLGRASHQVSAAPGIVRTEEEQAPVYFEGDEAF